MRGNSSQGITNVCLFNLMDKLSSAKIYCMASPQSTGREGGREGHSLPFHHVLKCSCVSANPDDYTGRKLPAVVQTYMVFTHIRSSVFTKVENVKVRPLSTLNNSKTLIVGEIKNDSIFLIFRHFILLLQAH